MGSEPVQISALLSVYEDDGEFTLRVDSSALAKSLTSEVTRIIGATAKARKLTLLTPTDTKIFKFNGVPTPIAAESSAPVKARERVIQDQSAPPAPEVAVEEIDEFERELAEAAKAEREIAQMARSNSIDPNLPTPEEPAVRKRVSKDRPSPATLSACGRCSGAGTIDGGGACPVCRGAGSISHYGRGGRR